METLTDLRMDDESKVNKLIPIAIKPEIIYQEIKNNIEYFSNQQIFDGGFSLDPFVSKDTTEDSFKAMWHPKTANYLRIIRNALVHGKEKRFGKVIQPTERNEELIKPWCAIIRRISEHVILYC